MMRRRRPKQRDPMLMGEPSPALSRIKKMNMADLATRIATLKMERARLADKIARLKGVKPPPEQRIGELTTQIARLEAIEQAARERLDAKVKRKAEWDAKHGGGRVR